MAKAYTGPQLLTVTLDLRRHIQPHDIRFECAILTADLSLDGTWNAVVKIGGQRFKRHVHIGHAPDSKPLPNLEIYPTTWLTLKGFTYDGGQHPADTIPGHILSDSVNPQLGERVKTMARTYRDATCPSKSRSQG